jgi:geranylgeranyl reductase family protein
MDYDVIIAGAGPAGSTCARLCATAGIRTLLLERSAFPRPKPCGGALSERGLLHLGLSLPPELIERECFGVRVHYGTRAVEVRKDRRIAVMVDRVRFDAYLADRAVEAGAELLQEEPLQDISPGADRVEVRTTKGLYQARCLVGADGANSIAGRTVRPLFPRAEIFAALVGSCPGDDRDIDARSDGLLDLYFGIAPMGYGWVFPHKGQYGVGVLGQALEFDAPQKVFSAFSAALGMQVEKPRGHTIPMGGIERPVIGRRTILVGDAAGFADPFHGGGMENAIFSGKLAARAVVDGIGGKKDALSWYQRESDRLIVQEMKVALSLSRMLVRYPRFFRSIFFSTTDAMEKYLDIPGGRSDYVQFRKWLLARLPRYFFSQLFRKGTEPI